MNTQFVDIDIDSWKIADANHVWISALEDGKVLHFTKLPFSLSAEERNLLKPEILGKNCRNISLDVKNNLKGAIGKEATLDLLASMMSRFRENAHRLITSLAPNYREQLHISSTSFRPIKVETRKQSFRANDKLLHFDAFPTRPNYGQRIIRVFININPDNIPRVWRIGEPFEAVANNFLPKVKPYSFWQAYLLNKLKITKAFRSEYDHIMLQIHDIMKFDAEYQANSPQTTIQFYSGSVWMCLSDQASHAVMSGQYMMEQTFNLPVSSQYNPEKSPLAVLSRLTNKALIK